MKNFPNILNRLLYLGYYFKKLDWRSLNRFMNFTNRHGSFSKPFLWSRIIIHSIKYNISFLEYFQFGFYKKNPPEKLQWAGSGYMYEYHLQMNPKEYRDILKDKIRFLHYYQSAIQRKFATLEEIKNDVQEANSLLDNSSGKIILKQSKGQVGEQVSVCYTENLSPELLISKMKQAGYDLAEEYVIQHPSFMELSDSGVNTVRIITQLDDNNKVHFLGARLRISVNSHVDNLGAGNLAAPIDMETGKVNAPAVYSDITKEDEEYHPITGTRIVDFQIPFWSITLSLAKEVALMYPQNRSVGWDIAITPNGPELIEGNHNWCKLLWQLPVKKGLKPLLEQYINK